LAPTPSKPHRVCDACYAKLKGSESSNASHFNKEITRPSSSVYGREKIDRVEVRPSKFLLSSTTGLVKSLGSTHESSSMAGDALQLKDIIFPGPSSATQSASRALIMQQSQAPTPPSSANSRPPSPYSRRPPSPTRSVSPGFSRSLIESLKKKNEHLNQEVSKLQNNVCFVVYTIFKLRFCLSKLLKKHLT